jgi:ABC-type amino acid transport substrate-binding protein
LIVDFSTGRVLKYEVRLLIRQDSDMVGLADANQPSRRIACGAGTSQVELVHEFFPRAEHVEFTKVEDGLMSVVTRDVDGMLADQSIPNFIRLHPECTVLRDAQGAPVILSVDYSHPMLKPGDPRFLRWVDNWMDFHEVQGNIERIKAEAERAFEAKFERIMQIPLQRVQA